MEHAVEVPDEALRLLVERGFDATSVDQLAMALGMSRSTFFRRFGSKEDMVFADMDAVIDGVRRALSAPGRGLAEGVAAAALSVFDHHTARPGASLLRHRLLQEVPALRDRELVSTHRYERAFRHGLLAAATAGQGDGPGGPDRIAATAYAASVVSVHNAFLRDWLRTQDPSLRERLAAELSSLAALFLPRLGGTGPGPSPGPRAPIVVAVAEPGTSTDEVLAAVRRALDSGAAQDHATPTD